MNKLISKSKINWIKDFLYENLSFKIILNLSQSGWEIEYENRKCILPFFEWLYIYPNKKGISINNLVVERYNYKKFFLVQINLDNTKNKSINYYDYIGMIFWTLNLYEDKLVNRKRDKFGRFSAYDSLAFKNEYLDHPYIEYILEFLRDKLRINKSDKNSPELHFSHDLDHPNSSFTLSNIKNCIKLLFNGDLYPSLYTIKNWVDLIFKKDVSRYYLIQWLLNIYKKNKLSAFFFIQSFDSKIIRHKYDCEYDISSPEFLYLVSKLISNKQNIGLHLSLLNDDLNQYSQAQLNIYKKVISYFFKPDKTIYSNRAHFLQFDKDHNYFDFLSTNEFTDDYSVGFFDRPGFRVGTGNSYQLYEFGNKINIHPLICMEVSLTSYMRLGFTERNNEIIFLLAKRAYDFKSDFSLLWHDNNLISNKQKKLFLSIFYGLRLIYNNS